MASNIQELIVLKDGSSINGEVLVKTFVLKLQFGTLKLAKSDILTIEYKNPPFALADEFRVSAGTRLHGDSSPAVIPVRVEHTAQILRIPKTDIHSLVFFTAKGKVSAATRKALKSVA